MHLNADEAGICLASLSHVPILIGRVRYCGLLIDGRANTRFCRDDV